MRFLACRSGFFSNTVSSVCRTQHNRDIAIYHTYTLTWDEAKIEVSIDDITFHTFNISDNSYFHSDFYILLNLAVGGAFTNIYNAEDITTLKDCQTTSMYIDWIKVTEIN